MDLQQGNHHMFQTGSEPFPRTLPDNCVEYMLFILETASEPRALLAELENIRRSAMQLCLTTTKDYIWQRDSFQLQVKRADGLVYLHGTTDYGDSIEDEWLIVYLLRTLTTTFPSLWVRVFDSDGEFLLVEAANIVPKWLSPEIDSNRTWIHQGKLKLIPLSASSGEKRPLTLIEAVSYIRLHPDALVHSPFIEAEAFYRLEKYPDNIRALMHHSLITIPRKLVFILHEQPAAIAPATEAFYLRDPTALKPLMTASPDLHFPPKDLVTVSVRFTKVIFAQFKSQQFTVPPLWSDILKRTQEGSSPITEQERKQLARLELGMKVASGFEILAASASKKDNRLAREFAILLEDVEEDGDNALPTDEDITTWPNINREDDEAWLNIDFEDFDNELQGRRRGGAEKHKGFGDSKAQADLRKIVSRFQDFLNDETAGIEGAELDDMDEDNDSSDEGGEGPELDDDSSEDEDKAVSFDEDQFNRMMREMMGMPPEDVTDLPMATSLERSHERKGDTKVEDEGGEEEEDGEAIRQLAAQMEAELREYGALGLDVKQEGTRALNSEKDLAVQYKGEDAEEAVEDSGDEEVDIDYNLAKNLLESFKSQAGLAGPAGNLMGMMGMKLPRDEDEDEEPEDQK
ncbi:SGT1-domain-containing protein [Xylaria bambusicola]|uniref:SGT1-domain-containing protein n=1 Tax=Xylaria bambusicola TaxID=326684 RepID=UPI00200744AB|nr:SGT1-domain-containing protein [Xylaria bambusicola]KAI0517693.1 SGT1-domain-containing protein [Xylaria bambusicola]